jgi:hypothetical protein
MRAASRRFTWLSWLGYARRNSYGGSERLRATMLAALTSG